MRDSKTSFKDFLASSLGRAVVMIVLYLVIFGLFMLAINANVEAIMFVVVLACAIPGWRFLNRITPDMFLFMSITGWVIYFVVKFALAVLIGMFITPFYIARTISEAVQSSL